MPIRLSPESARQARESIKRFFPEQLDEEIGDLKAELLLDFFLKEIAPSVYNRAVSDAQSWLQDRVAEVDGTCFEKEFSYWDGGSGGRGGKPRSSA